MKQPARVQTRLLRITHPYFPEIVLFEAQVQIFNINTQLVQSIENVEIQYSLKEQPAN